MRPSWDEFFLGMAFWAAVRSKDPSTKVGAVIVGPDYDPRSTGYNGFPRGVAVTTGRLEHPFKYKYTEHAERNAIYLMARRGDSTLGCTLYSTLHPCVHCARGLIQSGIARVVIPGDGFNGYEPLLPPRREALGFDESAEMLAEAGIPVEKINFEWGLKFWEKSPHISHAEIDETLSA